MCAEERHHATLDSWLDAIEAGVARGVETGHYVELDCPWGVTIVAREGVADFTPYGCTERTEVRDDDRDALS